MRKRFVLFGNIDDILAVFKGLAEMKVFKRMSLYEVL